MSINEIRSTLISLKKPGSGEKIHLTLCLDLATVPKVFQLKIKSSQKIFLHYLPYFIRKHLRWYFERKIFEADDVESTRRVVKKVNTILFNLFYLPSKYLGSCRVP